MPITWNCFSMLRMFGPPPLSKLARSSALGVIPARFCWDRITRLDRRRGERRVTFRVGDPIAEDLVHDLGRDAREAGLALGAHDRGVVGEDRGEAGVGLVAARGALEDAADVAQVDVRARIVWAASSAPGSAGASGAAAADPLPSVALW